jgi:hypothetical protein
MEQAGLSERKSKVPSMQCDLIYACELSCAGEHFITWKLVCGYGAVLWVMTGQSWWQAASGIHRCVHYEWQCVCRACAIFIKERHHPSPAGLQKNVCRLGVEEPRRLSKKIVVWDLLSCRAISAVPPYSAWNTVNHMTLKTKITSLKWKQLSPPTQKDSRQCDKWRSQSNCLF